MPPPTPPANRPPPWLLTLILGLALLRCVWIATIPDLDGDAYGHFRIAINLSRHPADLSAHWVWLPLYHYILACFVHFGATLRFMRYMQNACMTLAPLVLFRLALRRSGKSGTPLADGRRNAALVAGAYALSTSANVLGISAQQEGLFALLILLCVDALDRRRALAAGVLLAAACLIRYEAWGAAALAAGLYALSVLAARVLTLAQTRALRKRVGPNAWALFTAPSLAYVAPPVLAVASWFLIHRLGDGTWLGFLRGLYTFTHMQRVAYSRGALYDALWFPVIVPLLHLGFGFLCVPFGLRGAVTRGWVAPIAIYMFLLGSYAGGGSLGASRYYGALMPYFTWAAIEGVRRLTITVRPWARRTTYSVVVVSLVLSMANTAVRSMREAAARAPQLAEWEADMVSRQHEAPP